MPKSLAELNVLILKLLKLCPLVNKAIFSEYDEHRLLKFVLGFLAGVIMGQMYYYFLLQNIPFPYNAGVTVALVISLILGMCNAVSRQVRCISMLLLPMYCGKAGRGMLKAVILTYVISGPITNLGLNAKEVVRVFACSNEMTYNLSKTKFTIMSAPITKALFGLNTEIDQVKDTLRSIKNSFMPIYVEVENTEENVFLKHEIDANDEALKHFWRSTFIEERYRPNPNDTENENYQKRFGKKMEYRCQHQLAKGTQTCKRIFSAVYEECYELLPDPLQCLCLPLKLNVQCDLTRSTSVFSLCDSTKQINPGLGEGYDYLKKGKEYLTNNLEDVKLQYKVWSEEEQVFDIQDAKETGQRVINAFEEKYNMMRSVFTVINVCLALLFLRVVIAAINYHDLYLTNIEYDNFYVTHYFKTLDERRKAKRKFNLLPMKKMERSRYIDIDSVEYITVEHHKLVNRILKVMLEMITATTFVMLDRLFYEALDVVRKHSEMHLTHHGTRDMEINVEGIGTLGGFLRRLLEDFKSKDRARYTVNNQPCLPRPRLLPPAFYLKIYGGYLWIVLLLYFNAYTLRLRRLICSYFYPHREKQRILHLYNDILKKRLKMNKTLRKKAAQATRTYFLSDESLLSLRLKFPHMLGWLSIFPAARMKCLICGETEPRKKSTKTAEAWHGCNVHQCPFVYCAECWREVGYSCLACHPSLVELSDADTLTEDELPGYGY